jgi:hypothetical protein
VEVGGTACGVAVRDTKVDGRGPVLRVTPRDWQRFTASLKR